ncbi:MAG TPA: riboflavin kinase [Patescibacteria group bacterium]
MEISGIVKKNLGRGKKLGYPTANIDIDSSVPDGLFLGITKVEGKEYPSIIFIGAAQTFGEQDRKAEAYLLNFSGNLYEKMISIRTIKKLRNNLKFETQEALVKQMRQDEQVAREFFRSYNTSN